MTRHAPREYSARSTLLAAGLLAAAGAAAAPDSAGRWQGVAEIPGGPMTVVVDLDRDGARRWVGSVILPGHGVKGAPIRSLQASDAGLRLDLAAAFRGSASSPVEARLDWRADGALAGELLQGGHVAPLVLRRAGAAQVDLPVPSTPVSAALEGTWVGRYELDGVAREVTLKLANGADGTATGELLIVGRRNVTLAVDRVRQGSEFITLDASVADFRIEGRWSAGDGSIRGQMLQGPFAAPLVLRKTAAAAGNRP